MIKCAFWLHLLTGFWPELRVLGTVSEYETASFRYNKFFPFSPSTSFGYKKFFRSTSFRYTTSENPLFLYGFHNFPLDYPQAYPQHAISLWITIIPPVSKTRITYLKLVLHAPRTRKSCPQNSQFLLKLVDNPLILLDFRATARSLIYRLILFVFKTTYFSISLRNRKKRNHPKNRVPKTRKSYRPNTNCEF